MNIPIRNLFYLLSYVWDIDWELEWSNIDVDGEGDALNLLTKVLIGSTDRILRRGLDRGYQDTSEQINGVRGRIDISNSLKRNGLVTGKLICVFDELSYSVPHNQIIKATLERVSRSSGLSNCLREDALDILRRLRSIEPITLDNAYFSKIKLHSNIRNYRLPVSVCKLLYDQLMPHEHEGTYEFVKIPDEKLFVIFEKFIFNFYKKHIDKTIYTHIKKERLGWQDTVIENDFEDLLPTMETDISLFNDTSKLVIECKFYETAVRSKAIGQFESKKTLISSHLYQLLAYLKNLEIKDRCTLSGLLLYPENSTPIDATYTIHGHKVSVKTINLAASFQDIHDLMLSCLSPFNQPKLLSAHIDR